MNTFLRKLSAVKFYALREAHLRWYNYVMRRLAASNEVLEFQCNICGKVSKTPLRIVCERDQESCLNCKSNLRVRSIIHILSMSLFNKSIVLPDFPVDLSVVGGGMSDWSGFSRQLESKFSYTNTFYHKEPKLDITSIKGEMEGKYDFFISSDVFEHVLQPLAVAFLNLRKIVKPGGMCVFTVPFMNYVKTWEHFPDLYDFELISEGGAQKLINTTEDGVVQEYLRPVFHGGKGATLELRVFSRSSLIADLSAAGFKEINFHQINYRKYGIIWPVNWSLPMSIR